MLAPGRQALVRRWRASAPKSAKAPAFGEVVQLSCFTLWRQKGSDQAEPGRDRRETVGASFFSVAWQTVGELQERSPVSVRSECDAMTVSLHPGARSQSLLI